MIVDARDSCQDYAAENVLFNVRANQRSACPRVSRVCFSIHGGNLGPFDVAHIFLDDISALEYTGLLGSQR